MKRFRRWLFKGLAMISLVLFIVAVAVRIFALSANDNWTYDTKLPLNGGGGSIDRGWKIWFGGGGFVLIRSCVTFSNFAYHPSVNQNQWHHEATPASAYSIQLIGASIPTWNSLVGSSVAVKGFGWRDAGVYCWHTSPPSPGYSFEGFVAGAPLWPFAIVCLVTAVWAYRKARSVKIKDGICIVCGYNLCATPDRCPECGTIPPKKGIISN